ncbi:NUDIX hydrolase [Guggenheimella bovis]
MRDILRLYTKDRKPTDQTILRGEMIPKGLYHQVVHLCIFNSKGELLIQKRSPLKSSWSGLWDVSVGGCVSGDESSTEGMHRECLEELGLDLTFERAHFTINFDRGFDDYYFVELDLDPKSLTLQEEEVEEARFATKDEVLDLLEKKLFIPYRKEFIELLFTYPDVIRNHSFERE